MGRDHCGNDIVRPDTVMPAIRLAIASDLKAATHLLRTAGLPTADLTVGKLALVAEIDSELQGIIGIERPGDLALLRSLVIVPAARGDGIGASLVAALESMCVAEQRSELWLLTINADTFFRKCGFATRLRSEAPDLIQKTQEFSVLCPGDAVLMSKQLSD